MVIEVKGAALVIGRTSRGLSTRLEPGRTDVDDDHWTEIVSRYGLGLAPHLRSGRLTVRPSPPPPVVTPTPDPLPSLVLGSEVASPSASEPEPEPIPQPVPVPVAPPEIPVKRKPGRPRRRA